jgi:hypothetical protein
LASGCVQVSDFDPVGNAASISGAWTIDGAAPSAEACRALGADLVRVVFLDEDRPVVHGALIYRCDSACGETCFDTRPAPVVGEGEWTIRLEAVGNASVVAVAPPEVRSSEGGHIALTPASFLSGRISATYRVGGNAPTFEACRAAGIATVEIAFESAGGEVATPAREDCSVGTVGTRVAPNATYVVRLRALGPTGEVVRESMAETLDVDVGEHEQLNADNAIELVP